MDISTSLKLLRQGRRLTALARDLSSEACVDFLKSAHILPAGHHQNVQISAHWPRVNEALQSDSAARKLLRLWLSERGADPTELAVSARDWRAYLGLCLGGGDTEPPPDILETARAVVANEPAETERAERWLRVLRLNHARAGLQGRIAESADHLRDAWPEAPEAETPLERYQALDTAIANLAELAAGIRTQLAEASLQLREEAVALDPALASEDEHLDPSWLTRFDAACQAEMAELHSGGRELAEALLNTARRLEPSPAGADAAMLQAEVKRLETALEANSPVDARRLAPVLCVLNKRLGEDQALDDADEEVLLAHGVSWRFGRRLERGELSLAEGEPTSPPKVGLIYPAPNTIPPEAPEN